MTGRELRTWTISRTAIVAALVLVAVALQPSNARAALIDGAIGFGGQWIPRDAIGNATSIQNATQVDVVGDQAVVTAANGDFAGLLFSFADYNDFSFNPFAPATPLWSVPQGIAVFSFDLLSVVVDTQTQTALSLVGTGLLRGVGFDDTPGVFTFSGDGTGGTFTFSNTANTTAIPEPQTLGLFGIGLLAIGHLMRRRRKVAVRA